MPAARTPLTTPPIALALLAGVCACLLLPVPVPLPVSLVASGGGAVLLASAWRRGGRWRALVGAMLVGLGLAGMHVAHALAQQVASVPARQDAIVIARIADLPRPEPRRIAFDVRVERAEPAALVGRRLRLSWYADDVRALPVLHAGETWRFGVRLRAPRGLRNPGGADAERHAMADRLAATGYVHGSAQRLAPASGIEGWRDAVSARIGARLHRRGARFIRALALGDTRFLTDDDWRVLRADGLTHLIAISGFHVGMVASVAAMLTRLPWWLWPALGRRVPARIAASTAGVAGALAYAAASGFSLPTVRTLLMIVVVAAARGSRRNVGTSQALALAAIAMLVVDPLSVLAPGFWLSFAGVAWLLWCMPRSGSTRVGELVRAQAVATVGLLPLTVLFFGQASVAGPVANLLAVPWWSLVVAPLSVAGVGLDALHPGAGAPAWRLAAWCFDIAWPLFARLASTPASLWYLPEAPWPALVLALLGAFWCLMPRGTPGRALGLVLMVPMLWPDRHAPAVGNVEATAVDVGQGLSVLVRTHRHALLYDMGPAVPDGFDAGERAVVPVLRARGVPRLDRLVVSHADLDHVGGLASVRRELPGGDLQAPAGSNVPGARACIAGETWTWDGVRFEFLHPPPRFPYLANDSSCVLRIEGGHGAILLTGDISADVEARLTALDAASIRADVVFVAHHGSRHSSDPAFVQATGARYAIVSSGHANRFRHPNAGVVARWEAAGARVLNTAESGAVTVRLDGDGASVREERTAHPRLWDAARRAARDAGLSYRRN